MRRTYKAGLSWALAALLGLGWAAAAKAGDGADADASVQRLMRFAANNSEFDKKVEGKARALFAYQVPGCAAPEKSVRQLPTKYGQIVFPADPDGKFPYPSYGVWGEHVKLRACQKIWTINMLAVARGGQPPMLLALLPGETHADPAGQRDAERVGATAVRKADAGTCSADAKATYTQMIGYRTADGKTAATDLNQGWFEQWTYEFCGHEVPVQMVFLPNDRGAYEVKARVAPAAQPALPASKPALGAAAPAGSMPANQQTAGSMPANQQTAGSMPANQQTAGSMPANQQTAGSMPANQQTAGSPPESNPAQPPFQPAPASTTPAGARQPTSATSSSATATPSR